MKITINQRVFERAIDYNQIKKRIRLIGIQLNVAYENQYPVFIGVLNGCFMFMADLMKQIHITSEISFVKLASYDGSNRREHVDELIGLEIDLKGREVVVVEDIVDTGNSLKHTLELIEAQKPASISVCTLLLKPAALRHSFSNIAYVGFEISDDFVVGYGLDYQGLGRTLPDIYKEIRTEDKG
ncbi:hypoxanthine phosphoribosyltransferase [Parapedobacter defluvii]|uniref:Hypoxanthine phosphoribosyltransferase n=1 Tax=Parapedobacter defluvii TaxID=2045106 RepID=A0ABQ1MPC2_9SPHI|nr:hypoxanthine phosphoribosyltransferase [Parapedobacter defluvii]RQP08689.1 MAG: hypoxanthine phosphoribosyltransferase [Parapedobacter sp.]GGC44286.1 hypoxanthine phosphoribosyltransferase [Parapedobacter defluvii]